MVTHSNPPSAGIRRERASRSSLRSAACAFVVLMVSASSCSKGGGRAGFTPPPTPVEVADVQPHLVQDQYRAVGSIDAADIIEVASELNAVVVDLPFTEGQEVAKGALIARLDDREFRADADRTEAQRELAESNAERSRHLYDQQVISKRELDDVLTSLKVAQANEALAKARLDKTRITAPFPGLIGRRRVSPGQYLRQGDVVTDLARVDHMKVVFAATERYAGEIRRRGGVLVTTPAFPGQTFEGQVDVVDPMIDPQTRTVIFVARIDNPERRLRPGMSANVTVTFAERPDALTIPQEAVFEEGGNRYVFRVNPDSTVARVAVQLGTRDSTEVEVVHGLDPGSMVVRAGHQKLYEGAKVMPVPGGAAAAGGGQGAPAESAGAGDGSSAAKGAGS